MDEDFDEVVSRKFVYKENSGQKSCLVIAGESAVVSAPSNLVVFRTDEIAAEMLEDGDWEKVMDSPGPRVGL